MRFLRRFLARFSSSVLGRRDEERLREEMEDHLARMTEENVRAGMAPAEARRHAALKFGGVEAIKEEYRDRRGFPLLDAFLQDTRHALRRLRKAPVFTLTAILTLALGIGATTSIFTLVHAVLLRSLPVANPERLYRLGKQTHCCVWGGWGQGGEFSIVSNDLYEHFRHNTRGFEQLAAFQGGSALIAARRAHSAAPAERLTGEFVSGNYFATFGINAWAGRVLTESDDRTGAPPAAVMSYRAWQQSYGLDPSVIGGSFMLNNKAFTVVGVTPPGFFGDTLRPDTPDFFLPLSAEPMVQGDSSLLRQPSTHWLDLIGRARPGVDAAALESEMRVQLHQWLRAHLAEMTANERERLPKETLYVSPGGAGITSMREAFEHWLQILMIASGFVLLIVCANLANLMLVRGMERRQQTSLSMALGARPLRLVLAALSESLILSLAGGAAGLAVAYAGTQLILRLAFQAAFTPPPISASPSLPVLLFAFAVSLITGVAFGIAPAWMATRVDPVEALRGAGRSTHRAASLPRKTLVILQAALSLVLLSTSGLLTAALRNLEHQDFGFEQDRRLVVNLDPLPAGYKPAQLELLFQRIRDSLSAIPGVSSVAACMYSPQNGDSWNDFIYVEGRPAPGPKDFPYSSWNRVSARYFETIGNPIIRGRPITERDTANSPHVAVINEAFARQFFKNEDPIGKRFGRTDIRTAASFEIVGIAKDARYLTYELEKPVGAFFFVPDTQTTVYPKDVDNIGEARSHYLHDVVIRLAPGAVLSEAQVRSVLAGIDPNLPVVRVQSLAAQVSVSFSQQRLIARLTSLYGVVALILASIGLYGITAYNAASRTNEIGVRMALGAGRRDVLALVLQGALSQIGLGLIAGIPLAVAAGRFLGNQLYGVSQYDPVILGTSILALAFPALAAALIPAVRASSVSPLAALRAE